MEKLDLNKMYKDYYAAKTKPAFVEIEEANYLAIKGNGDPAQQECGKGSGFICRGIRNQV